jgi:hypothetical protein
MYSDSSMFIISLVIAGIIALVIFGVLRVSKNKISWGFLIGFAISLLMLFFTFQKINKMDVLRGDAEGRQVDSRKITRKSRETYKPKSGPSRYIYYLCYENDKEICTEVSEAVWNRQKEGETFSVISLPGEDETYHASGTYLTEDNYAFDHFLMIIEILAAVFCLIKLLFPNFLSFKGFGKVDGLSITNDD